MPVPLADFLTYDEQTEEIEGIPTIIFSLESIQIYRTNGGSFYTSPAFKLVHTDCSTANGETVTLTPVCVSCGSVPTSMGHLMATSARRSSNRLGIREQLMPPELHQIQQDAQHMTAESDVHPLVHGLLRYAKGWTIDQSLEIAKTAHQHGFTDGEPSSDSDPVDNDRPFVFATTGKVIYLQSHAGGVLPGDIHMFILPGMACRTESTDSVNVTAYCYAFKHLSGAAPCPDLTNEKCLRLYRRVEEQVVRMTGQCRAQTTVRQLSQSLREYESQIITVVAQLSAEREVSAEWPGRVITQLSELPFST